MWRAGNPQREQVTLILLHKYKFIELNWFLNVKRIKNKFVKGLIEKVTSKYFVTLRYLVIFYIIVVGLSSHPLNLFSSHDRHDL